MTDTAPTPPKRVTLSYVLEQLLTRGQHDRSSVTLARNAKGDTQIEVVVRTGEGIETITDAQELAGQVYDTLRNRYPLEGYYIPPGSKATVTATDSGQQRKGPGHGV